jgi:hypothetical protein
MHDSDRVRVEMKSSRTCLETDIEKSFGEVEGGV